MSENLALLSGQAYYLPLMTHIIQVTSYGARDNSGNRVLNNSTTRQYPCFIQNNEDTRWATSGAVDSFPYVAYVLSTPIGQVDAVPIRVEEQITIIQPSYWASETPRRMGAIKSYFDQFGNLFTETVTFQ
jgi:hypothetical protein